MVWLIAKQSYCYLLPKYFLGAECICMRNSFGICKSRCDSPEGNLEISHAPLDYISRFASTETYSCTLFAYPSTRSRNYALSQFIYHRKYHAARIFRVLSKIVLLTDLGTYTGTGENCRRLRYIALRGSRIAGGAKIMHIRAIDVALRYTGRVNT